MPYSAFISLELDDNKVTFCDFTSNQAIAICYSLYGFM